MTPLRILSCIVVILCGISGALGQASVEDGLDQLATAIVEKSSAADKTTIAVLPFANADGTCSVLSTYIVEELTLRLFSVPDSKLEIIERSQLEALLTEMKIGSSGLLNPETTKQLGNLSGVSALTLGTITTIGDQVRINARLVATDSGKTISAAAVNVPKTSALESLMEQPVTQGLVCGKGIAGGVVGAGPGSSSKVGKTEDKENCVKQNTRFVADKGIAYDICGSNEFVIVTSLDNLNGYVVFFGGLNKVRVGQQFVFGDNGACTGTVMSAKSRGPVELRVKC